MFLLMTAPGLPASSVAVASWARAESAAPKAARKQRRRRAGFFMGSIFEGEQVLHHAGEVGGLVQAAERVMELPVEGVELVVGLLRGRLRLVGDLLERGHFALGRREVRVRAGEHGGGDGRA